MGDHEYWGERELGSWRERGSYSKTAVGSLHLSEDAKEGMRGQRRHLGKQTAGGDPRKQGRA